MVIVDQRYVSTLSCIVFSGKSVILLIILSQLTIETKLTIVILLCLYFLSLV